MDIRKKNDKKISNVLPFVLVAVSLFVSYFAINTKQGDVLGTSAYNWSQTDWSGGINTGVVTGTVNTYTALSTLDVSTTGEIKMKIKTDWALSSWNYRSQVVVNNPNGSEIADYQFRVDINTLDLISASKMESDCSDLRITDSDGNLLPYWIQTSVNQCNTVHTYVWSKDTLANGNNTYYIYYGNSAASSAENGSNVFDFFDDFNDGSIGASWTTTAGLGSLTEADGKLKFHCDANVVCDWAGGGLGVFPPCCCCQALLH